MDGGPSMTVLAIVPPPPRLFRHKPQAFALRTTSMTVHYGTVAFATGGGSAPRMTIAMILDWSRHGTPAIRIVKALLMTPLDQLHGTSA
jgi:hypothetical protein